MTGLRPRLLCVQTMVRSLRAKSYSNLALTNALLRADDITPQDSAVAPAALSVTLLEAERVRDQPDRSGASSIQIS